MKFTVAVLLGEYRENLIAVDEHHFSNERDAIAVRDALRAQGYDARLVTWS